MVTRWAIEIPNVIALIRGNVTCLVFTLHNVGLVAYFSVAQIKRTFTQLKPELGSQDDKVSTIVVKLLRSLPERSRLS